MENIPLYLSLVVGGILIIIKWIKVKKVSTNDMILFPMQATGLIYAFILALKVFIPDIQINVGTEKIITIIAYIVVIRFYCSSIYSNIFNEKR